MSNRMHVLEMDVTHDEHVSNAVNYVAEKCKTTGKLYTGMLPLHLDIVLLDPDMPYICKKCGSRCGILIYSA